MKRWHMVAGLVLVLVLAACGGDQGDEDRAGGSAGGSAALLAITPSPTYKADPALFTNGRSHPAPTGEPEEFQAPFSVGFFVRQSLRGQAASPQTAGQLAVYSDGVDTITLTVLYFETPAEAVETVRYSLEKADPTLLPVQPPLYGELRSFGVSRDGHGGFTAAWTNENWAFIARAQKSGDALNEFLDKFSY